MSRLRLFWITLIALTMAALPAAAPLAHAETCRFVLGFQTLHDALAPIVGACLENEHVSPESGDSLQQTSRGLLVWRKADNHTAFTNGYATWVNGPNGLESRLNTQRFPWEPNPNGLPVVPNAYVGAAQFRPGPRLRVTTSQQAGPQGPVIYQLAGSGFVPAETVIIQGRYTPTYLVLTGNPQSPATSQTCTPVPFDPVQAMPDSTGQFMATLQAATNLLGFASFTARGSTGDSTSYGEGGSLPRVKTLPAGCRS